MSHLLRAATIAVLVALAAAACSGDASDDTSGSTTPGVSPESTEPEVDTAPPTPTPEPIPENAIKVGVLLDVGNLDPADLDPGNVMSPLDRQPGIALEAAVVAINEAGGLLGRPVSLIEVDTTSRLSVIDKASATMIEDGVELLVLTCELDFAMPAIVRAEAAGVLVLSPCAGEPEWGSGEAGQLAFSMVPAADAYGVAMAEYAWDQGYRNVTLLADVTAPEARVECNAFRDRWTELGGSLAFDEGFSLRSAELLDENPGVQAMREGDAVSMCAFPTIGLELIIGVRKLGIEAPILASPSLDSGTWLPIDVAQDSDGAADLGDFAMFTLASIWADDPSPRVADAISGFLALQATTPSSGRFVVGADLADIWAMAVEAADSTDGAAVAREIRSMRDVQTVSGALTFDGSQAPQARELRVLRHANGSMVFERLVTARR